MQTLTGAAILVVDDETQIQTVLKRILVSHGCRVFTASSVAAARTVFQDTAIDVAIVDYRLPDGTGADVMREASATGWHGIAFCLTGFADTKNVVNAMRAGFHDVLEKPFDTDTLLGRIRGALLQDHPDGVGEWRDQHAPDLLGDDPGLLGTLAVIRDVAETDCTVLVTGESGTGKELVAHALHRASPRAEQPFVALNCAAIPDALIESELFGYVRGAFTGAVSAREGKIASAHGGTLFLDEVGDLPLAAQAKLLRVLQDYHVTPVGSDRPQRVDVRVVAATNRDLLAMVEAGTFRADLFFRLSVVCVELPPLRERGDDVLPLARAFLGRANQKLGRQVTGFDDGAERVLREHGWPGNVRELENTIHRAVVLKRAGGMLGARDLDLSGRRSARPSTPVPVPQPLAQGTGEHAPVATGEGLHLRTAIDNVERQLIQEALQRTGGNRTEAAALLGLNRTTLVEKLRKLTG